jgi:hypothetical protein
MRTRSLIALAAAAFVATPGVAAADGGPTMPLSDVQSGMNCTADTVLQGTTISSFGVQVLSVVEQNGEGPRILVSVSGANVERSGVAEGFSGSPVYCPDPTTGTPENIGAISEGIGQYGNNEVLVTPIQQMLDEPVLPPSSAPAVDYRTRQLLGPLTVSGLSPSVLSVLQGAGERAGRPIDAAPAPPFVSFPVQPLIPGASVAASYSEGAIALGAVGTVTYRDGSDVYAFGHELDGAGRRSLLLQDAYVYGVVDNPDPTLAPSYKLASPGHTEGTLTSDTPNAVIGTVGAPPGLIPVDVAATDLDTHQTLPLDSDVADETDIGFPLGASLTDIVAPLEVAEAATEVLNGAPASESGRMCLQVYLRETDRPLGLCDRYVGTGIPGDQGEAPPEVASGASADVSTALGLLDSVQFANLHVTRLSAQISVQRGLAQAQIVAARAPATVRSGHTVVVHLLVRLYRGPLKTIAVPVAIPRGAHGRLVGRIHSASSGSSAGSSASLASALAAALTGASGGPSGPGPASLAVLRHQFAGVAAYDGLDLSLAGRATRRLFRDPSLLILGSAPLSFTVKRR